MPAADRITTRHLPTRRSAARVALAYAVIGCIWILGSDHLLHRLVSDKTLDALLSEVKGWFFVLATASMLFLALDRYFAVIRRHVADLQATEEALRGSEAEFRAIFELASIGMAQAETHTGRWTRVNPRMCAITGYSQDEMLRMSVPEITHPDDRGDDWEEFQQVVRGERPDYRREKRYVRKDGSIAWVNINMTVLRDASGRSSRTMATVEDISERIAAATALRESEERFRTVVENAPMGIFIQTSGRFAYLNRAAVRLFAPDGGGDLLGQPILARIQPDYHDIVRSRMRQLNEHRRPVEEPEERGCVRVDGTPFHAEFSAVPFDHEGEHGALVFFRDVTVRRRLEADLRQMQKLEAIGQLAGGVAHDFNNILAAIMMSLGMLRLSPQLDPETREAVIEIDAQARRAADLTRQLLMFSRRSVLAMKPLDLGGVISDLLKMLTRLIGEQVNIRFERQIGLPLVQADSTMIEQVLVNLAVNARDAMPRGGCLTIATSVVDLEPMAAARFSPTHTRFVCLTVTDTGTGIDAATRKRIFEPFFTTKEAGKGTGLGLATVHGIVAQHGGWLEVESEVGRGSSFKVFFPALEQVASRDERSSADEAPGGYETILLVEDEAAVRRLASRALKALGYRVLEAANGQEALDVWRAQLGEVHLLLTDMVMPEGLTGIDLINRLRAERPRLRAILSSGYSADIVQGGTQAAGVEYLPKPYDAATLASVVRRSLSARG